MDAFTFATVSLAAIVALGARDTAAAGIWIAVISTTCLVARPRAARLPRARLR